MSLPVFTITLFVSAFLLFLVQPMIGKLILPRLGGTPNVWNTCMVFFQFTLLVGYAYTHFLTKLLKVRMQLIVHGIFLFVPILLIGVGTLMINTEGISNSWFYGAREMLNPIGGGWPIPVALGWLGLVVGIPFMVIATSAPLLQRWFGHTGHPAGDDPYFLYAASNIGSFASLLGYPFFIEWLLGLNMQSWTWTFGYLGLVVLVLVCAVMVFQAPPSVKLPAKKKEKEPAPEEPAQEEAKEGEAKEEEKTETEKDTGVKAGAPPVQKAASSFKKGSKQRKKKGKKGAAARKKEPAAAGRPADRPSVRKAPSILNTASSRLDEVTPLRRLRWVCLAAIPSSLMLGVTTYITTDLSPIPLLWIIPLMLYLLSFVLVFSNWKDIAWVGIPHTVMVVAQPFAVGLLILSMIVPFGGGFMGPMIIHIMAFFLTTMVCHGELAKDRPKTEHLTEFYLLMSVGGVTGGIFNALVAPIAFWWGPFEYGLAIFLGGIIRPKLLQSGWAEEWFNNIFGQSSAAGGKQSQTSKMSDEGLSYLMDFALPILLLVFMAVVTLGIGTWLARTTGLGLQFVQTVGFGIPIALTIVMMGRPLRYGVAIGSVLLISGLYATQGEQSIYRARSYFGIIQVKENTAPSLGKKYTTLIHGRINHGMNFYKPSSKAWGDPDKDFSRLATTYYHRRGPAGIVMERFNWFHDPVNEYQSDARMPASLVGFAAQPLSFANLPVGQLVDLWSEPPFATIGLGTGTMASYARPFQHMHYYEIDSQILRLSAPPRKPNDPRKPTDKYLTYKLFKEYITERSVRHQTFFTYLGDAKARGAEIWVFMGDARLRMAQPYDQSKEFLESAEFQTQWDNAFSIRTIDGAKCGGPDRFYHMMVVDAFSSDAIPVHLLTKEAMKMYFEKLTEEGILCVHTSNRYVNLVPVVADVAQSLGYYCKRGHDQGPKAYSASDQPREYIDDHGHFTSEWVMVARKAEYLEGLDDSGPPDYAERLALHNDRKIYHGSRFQPVDIDELYWNVPGAGDDYIWTDDYSNVMSVFREFMRARR